MRIAPGFLAAWVAGRATGWAAWFCLVLAAPAAAPVRLGLDRAQEHWAFQPVHSPSMPRVQAVDRVRTSVDAFLLARLEKQGLSFAPPANRHTWLRRVTFDLTGLPPTFEDYTNFERNASPAAFEQVVDRLLSSPQYGERWGRHWLDVARYADTKDLVLLYGRDAIRPWAYTYRDYVVRALNEDLPYDEFITDQLAADMVQPPRAPWRLAGMGFLTLGRLFDQNPHDQIDDQIDTTTRGFLGLTVACARCHDHKYDPIGSDDYYALYGIFSATEQPYVLPLIEDPRAVPGGPEFEERLEKAHGELEQHIDGEYAKQTELFHRRLDAYFVRAATTTPDLWETAQFGLSLIPENLRPALVRRTRQLIATRARPGDRIFGPWARLMALGESADFMNRAAAVLPELNGSANPLVLAALNQASLTNRAAVAAVYGRLLYQLDVAQQGSAATPATNAPPAAVTKELLAATAPADREELLALFVTPQSPLGFPRRETPDHMSRPDKDRYGGLVLGLDKMAAHATNRPPARAMVVRDLPDPPPPRIFQRGSPNRPGDVVPRALPRVLTGGVARPFSLGSGRLELARGIGSTTNPLTARVLMNRVWMHHFGEPLVNSPADFGTRCDRPVQGELLDWLAAEFIRGGMHLKPMHRSLVLSEAYRQGNLNPAARAADPDNRLFGWIPRRRVELEAMRDSLLAISGRMDATLGGRPVESPADATNSRRTIYSLVDRQNLSGIFRAFDFAAPDQCAERRPQTLVPQQALFSLNSDFVLEQALSLALRTEAPGIEVPARLDRLFRGVLGREPSVTERAAAEQFLRADRGETRGMMADSWAQLAQVLLISNEAVFVD